jgi:hypothetical protein
MNNNYIEERIKMKKLLIALFAAAFAFGSGSLMAAGGKRGAASHNPDSGSPGVTGAPFETPRGSGMELSDDEHEENENFSHGSDDPAKQAQGAWSNRGGND